MPTLHEFDTQTLDGQPKSLADYAGSVVLIVNVASRCGLTPQYTQLQELHDKYAGRGFSVLGFPCNQFGGQEPGTPEEIQSFCSTRYGVTFPLFAKLEVNGAARDPLYAFLTREATEPDGPGDIRWNFAKFLVDRDGAVRARFSPTVTPLDPALTGAIDALL